MSKRDHPKQKVRAAEDPAPEASDRVGYGCPPAHTRWPPGQSGNAKGRRKGSRGRKTIVNEIASETHVVEENGKQRRYSTIELILRALRNCLFEGNMRAFRAHHALLQRYGPQEPQTRGGFLVVGQIPQTAKERQEYLTRLAEQQRKYRER